MATYRMTPYERRARAQKIIQARENRSLYNNYLKEKESYEKQLEEERLKTVWTENEKNSQSFFVRGANTVGDLVANVITGAVKGLEGIADLGIGLVGGIGGIFDGDFQERAKNAIAYDWTGETFGNALQEALKYSYTTNGGIIENVASGIGQMLPSVVVSVATAGAGAPAAAAQVASLATLGVSAAGTSTEEAFQEGADYWAGLGYGAASGLVEVGTEKLFGGATKALTGAGILDGVTRSVADTGIKRIAKNALEEGFEEVVSELANPALKSIYKGSEAFNDYGNLDYWKGVGEAGLVGSLTALAYSGTVGYGLSKVGVGYVGKEADIADSLSEIATLKEKANNLQANGELIGVNEQKIADTTKKNYQNIEKVLQGVSEDKRSKLIEKFNLDKAFNADGSMSGQLSSWFNSAGESVEVSDGSQNELASLKKDSYSFNLRGQEQTIASDLDAISENIANKYMVAEREKGNNITIEQAREKVGKVKVFDGEMSDNAKESRSKFNKGLNYLNKISGGNVSFVITEANKTFNGLLLDGRTIYIGEDQFEKGTWAGTLVHEYTHLAEDSEEYAKMVDFLKSDDILVEVEIDGEVKRIPLWQKAQAAVLGKDYGFDENKIKVISEKVNAQMGLTPEEVKLYREFMTEVAAHETQYLLGTEAFIDKIVASDRSLARKLVDKILNLKEAFSKVGDKATRGQLKMLRQAEKLYLDAARKAGDMRLVKYILSRSPETEEEVDSDAQIAYNRKGLYKQIPKQEYAIISSRIMEDNSRFMARNQKLPRYGKARSADYFYVYENFAPGNFGVLKQIKITDANREYIASIEAKIGENNGEQTIGSTSELNRLLKVLKTRTRYNYSDNAYDSERRADSKNGGVSFGESESERIGNTEKGDGNKRGVRFALKDTVEQDVLAKYGKTYRWTEAGYILKDGTRLDLSGRNEGASGGYRTVDHRDIFDIYEDAEDYGTDAMNQFMARGNIRVMPESPGINLQVEPTEEQYRQIQDLVERLGWKERYFSVDFDDANGDTIDNITYEGAVSARKVVADIKYFFKEGSVPHQSELSKFRYSLKEDSASAYEYEQTMKFSLVEDKKTLDFLNEQKHIKVYRAMQVIDGKLYPPMAAKIKGGDGKTLFVEATQLGKWYQADEHPELVTNGKFTLNKGNGSSITAAYNPYWHTSKSPLNDQFTSAYKRDNLVTVECEVPESELTSGYKAEGAKDSVGEMSWHSGQVSSKLSGEKTRKVILSRWVKVNRILPDSEVASKIAKLLEGENVSIPDNTITPSLRMELEKLGVEIMRSGKVEDIRYSLKEDSNGKKLSESQKEFFKDSKVVDEQGRLLVVYHGSSKAGFTEFKTELEGSYFTADRKYAEEYAKGNDENVYAVYLNITKPFDTRDAEARRIFEEEFYGQWGNGAPLTDRGLLDWTDGADMFDFLQEKGYDYDGLIIDEGGTPDGNGGVRDRGISYVAFHREQIKNTTNLQPTAHKDIRFSLKKDQASLDYIEEKYKPYTKYLFINENGNQIKLHNIVLNESSRGQGIGQAFLDDLIEYADREGKIITLTPTREYGTYDRLKKWYKQNGFVENKGRHTNFRLSDTMYRLPATSDSNIRFNLVDDPTAKPYFYELTDGQIKKLLANSTKMKVYSKVEAEQVINTILDNSLGVGEKYGKLVGKSKAEVIEMLWRGLNTAEPGKQMHVALDIAEYIIQNSVLENLYEDYENSIYIDTINALKPYLHSLDLSALKSEIKYKFDNDNSAYLLWGKRKGEKGLTADQIKKELDERGFFIDSDNEADIFFRMDSAYREAVAAMKKKTKELLSSALSAEERKTLKNNIAREVLIAFDKNGKQSTFSKILEQYHKEALTWKEKYYDERTRNSVVNRLLDKVQKVKDWKLGTFLNASQYKTDIFKRSIDKLTNIKFRGDLNQSGTRDIVSGLKEWYSKSNPLLEGVYNSEIAEMLDDIATSEGKLTTQELRNLSNVVDYFKHFVETYNKVYRNGKYVEAQPIAEKYVSVIKRNQSVKVGWLKKYFEKYLTTFGDPMTVARYFDRYESGFYSEMLATLRESATNAQIDEMNIREPIEEFIKKNKKYFKEAEKKTVKYQGRDIPLLQAMYVYMAMNDVDTIPSFAKSGFVFNDGNSDVRIDGFAANEDVEIAEMQIMAKEIQNSLEKQFSAADKEYIEIARKIFNEDCRKRFSETSIILKGYTNAKEGDYVPIRRANIAKNVDTSTFEYEVNRASNASFTKDRVKGAKGELRVDGIDTVLDRHIRAVAQYANLAPTIEEYNKLFSLNTGEDNNKPVSVSTESRNLWAKGDEYFKKLISDIQGIPATKGDGIQFMAFIRGGYAKFQLGANPKVWVTQLSSFFAAGSVLDYSSIVKGIGVKAGNVDTYCELAKLRNNDNTVAMAQGVLDKIDKVGNVLMKPIGTVDRFVITKLFGACQVQVQKDFGLKMGTEENKVKAGELLKRVILETQQNSMATERSSAMRSGSEFMRTITMFSADSMKVIGRVVDSIGELSALKAKKKILTDANEIANIDKQIKQATKKVAKSTTSLITSAVFMALVAQLFRTLYNKDDEDDNVVANMTTDAIGNLFGGLPIFKDIYSRLVEGYDIDGYAYSAINDMLDSADNIFKMCGDIVSGEVTSQEVAKNIKNMVYAAGQIFGLPTRNVYNVAYGLTKRVSPSAAYKIDTAFYNKNYTSDLNKAIARGDDDMIATIVELMTDERVGGIGDSAVSKELNYLVTKGFDVIPRSVGEKITYNGEEINLTSGQRKQFKQVYSVANKAVASLVKLSQYESASDEVKTKAIKYIYNVYYNLALQDLLGVDLETKTVLFAEALDVEKLAIIVATANSLTADLDNKGKAISGTRKRKIQAYVNSLRLTAAQKYMIMGYLGFRNLKGETQVKAYINRLNLTKSEKSKLLKYSGYGE